MLRPMILSLFSISFALFPLHQFSLFTCGNGMCYVCVEINVIHEILLYESIFELREVSEDFVALFFALFPLHPPSLLTCGNGVCYVFVEINVIHSIFCTNTSSGEPSDGSLSNADRTHFLFHGLPVQTYVSYP